MTVLVGADTGGTFTDLVALDEATGELWLGKAPSTPAAPERALVDAFRAAGVEPAHARAVVLGTTAATNALLQRRGATVLFLTTAGFEDVPAIGRIDKADPYDLHRRKTEPLVARERCFGVRERVSATGEIVEPLEPSELDRLDRWVASRLDGLEGDVAIAVCLLFSYANPAHERLVGDWLRRRHPGLPVALSAEIAPIWREHERGSTTIAAAFVRPAVSRLVGGCERALSEHGFAGALSFMKSNGGQAAAAASPDRAQELVLSGLSGGIVAARFFGEQAGVASLVSLDVGGTSADIGIVRKGAIGYVSGLELEFGLPIAAPSIDLFTIGAGGGSIAWIDEGGLLRVGPASAGADPGPACYGKGGSEATVTDANLVLGRLGEDAFLGGRIPLDRLLAHRAVARIANELALGVEQAAAAIVSIANEGMANAIRTFVVDRGADPRDFRLVAFGGAGPLHACEIAEALGLAGVVVPPHPGLASALGTLLADRRVDLRSTWAERTDAIDAESLDARLDAMAAEALASLAAEGFEGEATVLRSVELRYAGQNHELEVPLPSGRIGRDALAAVVGSFHAAHEEASGFRFDDEPVELVHLNVTAIGAATPVALPGPSAVEAPEPRQVRPVRFASEGPRPTPVFRRRDLPGGWSVDGPCVIEEDDSTTLVLPGQRLAVSPGGLLEISARTVKREQIAARDDAVTMSIVGDRLVSIAQEMGVHMMRAAYSPIFSESRDFSCALFDRRGELLAQGFFCPAHLGAIAKTVHFVLGELGAESLEPGDVVLHNDPYRGGCHMPEHMLLRPIFAGERIVAFAATIGHMAEIGAMAVGSFASNATEVFQEGLRLPPVKLVRRGKPVRDVWKIVLSNHRTPRATWGDLNAMLGSLLVGERRFLELADELSLDAALEVCDALLDHSERVMRARVSEIPDGEYLFEDAMEDDGITAEPVRIRLRVVVEGDEIVADYTGSDPQARGPVNATFAVTTSATYNALLQVAGPDIPRNAGAYRCATTIAPPGSVVNVAFPGPSVGGNTETQPKLVGMILGALAEALPDRVMAAEGVTSCNFLFGGRHPDTGEPYAHYHFEASGWGGRTSGDGNSAQNHIHGNCNNTPVEVFERRFPFRVRSYGLVPDSGGAGRRRGGLGIRRVLEVIAPEITASALMDRVKEGAWGLFGGSPGGRAGIRVRRHGETELRTPVEAFGAVSPSKFANVVLRRGDEVVIESAGGGGFGDPFEREPALVLCDVVAGLVSPEHAASDYGVELVSAPNGPAVDVEATRRRRNGRAGISA